MERICINYYETLSDKNEFIKRLEVELTPKEKESIEIHTSNMVTSVYVELTKETKNKIKQNLEPTDIVPASHAKQNNSIARPYTHINSSNYDDIS
jgi:hypothetical protein